jgi:RNA polymerase sigma-70 factor, ECF subfamily
MPREDSELVRSCLEGNVDDFRGLVEKYQQRIYMVVYGIVLNREEARDLTQEVFLKAYRSLEKFKGNSQFYTWLYRIAFNLSLDAKRKIANRVQVEYDDSLSIANSENHYRGRASRPDRVALRKELYDRILRGLETLSDEQRTAIILREWEGHSYDEISKIMNCSTGTVMSRLHYAREKLKKEITSSL